VDPFFGRKYARPKTPKRLSHDDDTHRQTKIRNNCQDRDDKESTLRDPSLHTPVLFKKAKRSHLQLPSGRQALLSSMKLKLNMTKNGEAAGYTI
jgi:hypothetical protein